MESLFNTGGSLHGYHAGSICTSKLSTKLGNDDSRIYTAGAAEYADETFAIYNQARAYSDLGQEAVATARFEVSKLDWDRMLGGHRADPERVRQLLDLGLAGPQTTKSVEGHIIKQASYMANNMREDGTPGVVELYSAISKLSHNDGQGCNQLPKAVSLNPHDSSKTSVNRRKQFYTNKPAVAASAADLLSIARRNSKGDVKGYMPTPTMANLFINDPRYTGRGSLPAMFKGTDEITSMTVLDNSVLSYYTEYVDDEDQQTLTMSKTQGVSQQSYKLFTQHAGVDGTYQQSLLRPGEQISMYQLPAEPSYTQYH